MKPIADETNLIPDYSALAKQLLHLIVLAHNLRPDRISEANVYKLVCHSFAILMEASVLDSDFWTVVKEQARFGQLLSSLLLDEPRQPIRKGISDNIAVECSPSALLKKSGKLQVDSAQGPGQMDPEHSVRIDILATIWESFLQNFPQTVDHVHQCQEFFEIAHSVFHSVVEKSPNDHVLSEYLKQWSDIMLSHQTEEVHLDEHTPVTRANLFTVRRARAY